MDLETLKKALDARKGDWTAIASRAEVSRKSIERICLHGSEPNWATIKALWRAVFETTTA